MEAITHWAGNIVSYLVFLTVLTGLLPAHKYEKYIRLFAGCILLLIVLKPLTDGLRLEERLNYLFTSLSFENEAGELKSEMDEIEVRRRNMVLSQYEAEASKEAVRVAAEAGFFRGKGGRRAGKRSGVGAICLGAECDGVCGGK